MDVTQHELLTQELRREQAYLAEAQRLTHAGSWAEQLWLRGRYFIRLDENNRLAWVRRQPTLESIRPPLLSSILVEERAGSQAKNLKMRSAPGAGLRRRIQNSPCRRCDQISAQYGTSTTPLTSWESTSASLWILTDRKRVRGGIQEALSNALQAKVQRPGSKKLNASSSHRTLRIQPHRESSYLVC